MDIAIIKNGDSATDREITLAVVEDIELELIDDNAYDPYNSANDQ